MAKFTTWYSEEVITQIWFDAENAEEAQKMVEKIIDDETFINDLPNFDSKSKYNDFTIAIEDLEEVKNGR